MRSVFFYCISIVVLLFVLQCHPKEDYSGVINEIGHRYIPDKREGIFTIEAKNSQSGLVLKGETDNLDAHAALVSAFEKDEYHVIDSIVDLPSGIDKKWGLISLSVASLRTHPSHDAEMNTQALMGTPVKILKKGSSWALVQTPDHYVGWCEKSALSEKGENDMNEWKGSNRLLVKNMTDFVRDGETGKVVSDVVAGCIVEETGSFSSEVEVSLPDGRVGRLKKESVIDFKSWSSDSLSTDKLAETAELFIGMPYLWGGTSSKAVDCSGFTKTVYFLNGLVLARDASQQVRYGEVIPTDQGWKAFQTGDLLFFGHDTKSGTQRITHVGLYIGDSEVIHSSGRVRINSLDSARTNYNDYLDRNLRQVRRISGSENITRIVRLSDHPWY